MLEPDRLVINFIKQLEDEKNVYKLATTIPNLFINSSFSIQDNGNYLLSFELQEQDKSKGLDIDYFFIRPFILFTKGQKISIQNYEIVNAKQHIGKYPQKIAVECKAFKGDVDTKDSLWVQSKQTAYVKFETSKFEPYNLGVLFDLATNVKDNGSYNALNLKVDGIDLIFYYALVDSKNGYYIFKPNGVIDYTKFREIIDAIMVAFGLLSGYYMADTIYFVAQKSKGIESLTYRYENINKVINSGSPIISTGIYKDISDEKLRLTSSQFNNLVKLLYKHEEYKRSAFLLIEAGSINGLSKATLGAVALETITGIIGEKLASKVIIEDKEIINSIRYKLKKTLKEFSSQIKQQQHDKLKVKLENINNIPNADKLSEAFKLIGINLDEEELYCIKCRNLFLHGRLPKPPKDMNLSNLSDSELLDVVSNRLVMLSAMLLLKLANYGGYVIDKGLTEVIKWRMIRSCEPVKKGDFFREIDRKNDNN